MEPDVTEADVTERDATDSRPVLGLRGMIVLAICGLAVAASPLWGPRVLSKLAFFRVRAVEVEGAHYVAAGDVVAAMRVDTTVSVWDDVRPFAARLHALQEIGEATITRKLPGNSPGPGHREGAGSLDPRDWRSSCVRWERYRPSHRSGPNRH